MAGAPGRPAARKAAAATSAPAGRLAIRCFGALEARVDGAVVDEWPRRKAKLVLAALALVKRGLAGDQLAELYADASFTGNGLQVTVSALRRTLEPARTGRQDASFLLFADDRYQLRWDAVAFLDVAAFDAERAAAEACRRQDPELAAARYEAALAHYRGELLEEPLFAAYFEAEREKYRREALAAALWLGAHHEAGRRPAEAEAAWRRAVAIAPADEQGYLGLARHHAARGARERAIQACWDCRKALKARLGIAPSAELEALHRGLVGGP